MTSWPEPPELSSANVPTFKTSICLLLSTIRALLTVVVPAAWSNKDVKYLPPMISTEGATPEFSVPVPIYNLSPLFDCVPATYEYANSPVFILLGADVVEPVVKILILVFSYSAMRL